MTLQLAIMALYHYDTAAGYKHLMDTFFDNYFLLASELAVDGS